MYKSYPATCHEERSQAGISRQTPSHWAPVVLQIWIHWMGWVRRSGSRLFVRYTWRCGSTSAPRSTAATTPYLTPETQRGHLSQQNFGRFPASPFPPFPLYLLGRERRERRRILSPYLSLSILSYSTNTLTLHPSSILISAPPHDPSLVPSPRTGRGLATSPREWPARPITCPLRPRSSSAPRRRTRSFSPPTGVCSSAMPPVLAGGGGGIGRRRSGESVRADGPRRLLRRCLTWTARGLLSGRRWSNSIVRMIGQRYKLPRMLNKITIVGSTVL